MPHSASPALRRREFLATSAAAALGATLTPSAFGADDSLASTRESSDGQFRGRIYKSVKWGMIQEKGTILQKFELMKQLGFDGMELVSPGIDDKQAAVEASRKTGMPIHGLVDEVHWQLRLSSPDEAIRGKGLAALKTALADSKLYGGQAVLLVPGRVNGENETHEHVWNRSIAEIRKALPLASRLGVRILIENVWNGFCEKPEQLRDYIDEIGSPWVGSYLDIGNCRKFAPSEQWIRVLGRRIVKLDVKDWSQANGFCKIGDGDVNWPEVRKVLDEIGFTGWCTAEVQGGGRERLADIAARMNRVLGL